VFVSRVVVTYRYDVSHYYYVANAMIAITYVLQKEIKKHVMRAGKSLLLLSSLFFDC